MRNTLKRLRRHQPTNPAEAKPHTVRFQSTNGTWQQLAMGPGDGAAFGGTRVDIDTDGTITVTPWPEEN